MDEVQIANKLNRIFRVRQCDNRIHTSMESTLPKSNIHMMLSPDECKAIEAALAEARREASPTPEPAEPASAERIALARIRVETCNLSGEVLEEFIGDRLRVIAAIARDALKCRPEKPEPAEAEAATNPEDGGEESEVVVPTLGGRKLEVAKPTAEVIASKSDMAIVAINGVGFLVVASDDICRQASRRGAELIMLSWGKDPAEAKAATQAIDE